MVITVALNATRFNVALAVGPALGGLVVATAGPAADRAKPSIIWGARFRLAATLKSR